MEDLQSTTVRLLLGRCVDVSLSDPRTQSPGRKPPATATTLVTPTVVYRNAASLRTLGIATPSGFLMPTCSPSLCNATPASKGAMPSFHRKSAVSIVATPWSQASDQLLERCTGVDRVSSQTCVLLDSRFKQKLRPTGKGCLQAAATVSCDFRFFRDWPKQD